MHLGKGKTGGTECAILEYRMMCHSRMKKKNGLYR